MMTKKQDIEDKYMKAKTPFDEKIKSKVISILNCKGSIRNQENLIKYINSKINLFDESIITRQKDILEILELHLKDEMQDSDNLKERADEYKRGKL